MQHNLLTLQSRIAEDIASLAEITEPGRPYTRRAFTPKFIEGRQWLERRFEAARLETRIDAAGNLIGLRRGSGVAGERRTIMLGSHSDTVPDGGRFDGIAGVSAALEVARALTDQGIVLRHDLEIADFLAEEVSIFGISCVGSRGMAGVRPDAWLDRSVDRLTLRDGIAEVGGNASNSQPREDIAAFLELHIEQGPVLEDGRLDMGVVTAIAGITRIEIIVEGRADHAGTTPMGSRKDALAAAARLVLGIEALATARSRNGYHFAATVGEFAIEPGAANVVPSKARLLVDARAERRDDMQAFVAAVTELVARVAAETGVGIQPPLTISDNLPTPCDGFVIDTLDAACANVGARHRRMASGAGHDTAWMARICRAGMIFVPCLGGRSHTPDEHAEIADIALGAAVLLEAVQRLDREL